MDTYIIDGKSYRLDKRQSDAIEAIVEEFGAELDRLFKDRPSGNVIGNMPDRRKSIRAQYEARIRKIVLG